MPDEKTQRITISLTPSLIDKLDRLAHAAQRTRSNTIARFISTQPDPPR